MGKCLVIVLSCYITSVKFIVVNYRVLSKESELEELERKNRQLEGSIHELTATNQMLKDEQTALQLEFVVLQEKHNSLSMEHDELIGRQVESCQRVYH